MFISSRPIPAFLQAWLLLTSCLFVAGPVVAAVQSYTITGIVDGADLDTGGYLPPAIPPFAGGATFTLTFDLEDTTPLDFGGSTFSSYAGAISNIAFTASTGEFLDSPMSDVFAFAPASGDHDWSMTSGDVFQTGFDTNIPDLSLDDGTGSFDTFFFEIGGLSLAMADSLRLLFMMSPPELAVPDLMNTDSQTLVINWGSFFEDSASLPLTIQSITVPEPGVSSMLLVGCSALVTIRRRSPRRV